MDTLQEAFLEPCLWRGFFFVCQEMIGFLQRARPPFPVERRPSSLVYASFNPSQRKERGSKRLAQGALGPFALGDGSFSPRAPGALQVERRLA